MNISLFKVPRLHIIVLIFVTTLCASVSCDVDVEDAESNKDLVPVTADKEDEEGVIYSTLIDDNLTAEAGHAEELASGVAQTVDMAVNVTEALNTTEGTTSSGYTSKQALCEPLDREEPLPDVEIIPASTLQTILHNDPSITSRSTEAKCYLVYFFSPYCSFSVAGSAYVNGLARTLVNIPIYGLNSIEFHSMNSRYGVMGTPSLLLFHNGLISGRYNASEYSIAQLMSFINYFTTEQISYINVTSHDFKAELPSEIISAPSYILYLAWIFLISCGSWIFLTSETFAKLSEMFLNNWREAEAQHAHED